MPKNIIDYTKTIIYKICCKDPLVKDIYVGSTTNFIKRKNNHKTRCFNNNSKDYNMYVYEFIRNSGGWDNWEIVKIEDYNCNNHNEALKRERYWLETLQATLNKRIPFRKNEEYYQDNREKINENHKMYNKGEKFKEYRRAYYLKTKEQQKSKYESKKELKLQIMKQKYQDDIEKMTCECGSCVFKKNANNHFKTKKHIDYIAFLNNTPTT